MTGGPTIGPLLHYSSSYEVGACHLALPLILEIYPNLQQWSYSVQMPTSWRGSIPLWQGMLRLMRSMLWSFSPSPGDLTVLSQCRLYQLLLALPMKNLDEYPVEYLNSLDMDLALAPLSSFI